MVRPIDLVDNLSKTQAAERMNQIQKASGEIAQRAMANALKEQALADMERTRAGEKTDGLISASISSGRLSSSSAAAIFPAAGEVWIPNPPWPAHQKKSGERASKP